MNAAFEKYVARLKKSQSTGKIKPSEQQAKVQSMFPAVAKWVQGYGHIEIGDQESFGFIVRALNYGGPIFEDDKPGTLAEAMAVLEHGLAKWFKDEGIEIP